MRFYRDATGLARIQVGNAHYSGPTFSYALGKLFGFFFRDLWRS
jgi:hypothetical protein